MDISPTCVKENNSIIINNSNNNRYLLVITLIIEVILLILCWPVLAEAMKSRFNKKRGQQVIFAGCVYGNKSDSSFSF